MSKQCALIQYACGNEHAEMLALSREWHAKYCERIGAAYLVEHQDVEDGRSRHWRKIALIEDALHRDFQKVIWLDCDAVIVDQAVDLFELIGFGIGVCECFDSPTIIKHLNTGVVWAVRSDEVIEFLKTWDSTPRDDANPWQDQNAFIQLMSKRPHRDLLTILPNRFNCVEVHMEARNPVIRHFAGDPNRRAKIRSLMQILEAQHRC